MVFDWLFKMGKTKGDRQFELLDERLIDIQGKLRSLKANHGDRFAEIDTVLQQILEAIKNIQPLPQPQPKQLEVRFMFIVKDDHEPVNFSLVLGDVTDAEGNSIPDAKVDVEVLSSDESVLALSFDAATKSGTVSFGNPGVASLTASVSSGGKLLGSGAADFTVTVGDPAAISSVALNFDGLTEVPPA